MPRASSAQDQPKYFSLEPLTPAARAAGQAMNAVATTAGLDVGLDENGHAYLAGALTPDEHPRAAASTPRDVAQAVGHVEREATGYRRELLAARREVAMSSDPFRTVRTARGPGRRRESHGRRAAARRVVRQGDSGDSDLPDGESEPPAVSPLGEAA